MTDDRVAAFPGLLDELDQIVGADHILLDELSLQTYGVDCSRAYQSSTPLVVLPGSVEEVQRVVRLAAAKKIALVPSGGRTGLSGGAVATNGEIVLALDRLNQITRFSAVDRSLTCGAGVVTANLQQYAQERGCFYPVDFAASGSSQIGGNIATNAGGIKVIRYGMTRDWVAGLKLVTGSGELLDLNRGLVKNNAGYDLRHLVVGSEGTLGVIVEATMRLCSPPQNCSVMVLGIPDTASLMLSLDLFQSQLQLSAFEFFSELALQKVVAGQGLRRPFSQVSQFYALIEFEHADQSDIDRAMALFEQCLERGWVEDGVLSQSAAQAASLWRLREDISETIAPSMPYKNDIAVTVSQVPSLLADVQREVVRGYPGFEVLWYGHIGDGNVHLNILKPEQMSPEEFQRCCAQVNPRVFEIVERYAGSISAEHGVGLLKKEYLHYTRSALEIDIMRQIKRVFDPAGIMNPGKIFDL